MNRSTPLRPTCASWPKAWAAFSAVILGVALMGCTVGPDYAPPSAPQPVAYKELKGWKHATPGDDRDRGPWWSVFRDRKLDSFEPQVELSNKTVAAAEAAYRQSLATIKKDQAGLFPTLTFNYNATGSYTGGSSASFTTIPGTSVAVSTGAVSSTIAVSTLSTNASWDLDLWGKIRRLIEADVAAAQVSAADLANAKLSAQGLLATAYYNLRAADALQVLLDQTVIAFRRTLRITESQHRAGTASMAEVSTAEAQVLAVESAAINVGVMRAQFEHAIAVLIGKPPADFSIPASPLAYDIPDIPVSVPSVLLERRPDIAAAERSMQQQNALIGATIALYYPDVSLSGLFGFSGTGVLALAFANELGSVGGNVLQTAFDAGSRDAQVEAAMAAYQQSVATYQQVVLTAFQQVEDQLAAIRTLARQQKVADDAVKVAQRELKIYLDQYEAGTVAFTAVVVAQANLLAAQEATLAVRQNRFLAAVALIEALGGGWNTELLPSGAALEHLNPIIPRL